MIKNDDYFMKQAILEAKKSAAIDEVPIGVVIVLNDKIIARGHNVRETKNDALGHGELVAIKKANKKLGSWRLNDCVIYVTVEPCIMCAGAIIQSKFKKVVYGAKNIKGGAFGSSINVLDAENINWKPEVVSGVLEDECSSLLKEYFSSKR